MLCTIATELTDPTLKMTNLDFMTIRICSLLLLVGSFFLENSPFAQTDTIIWEGKTFVKGDRVRIMSLAGTKKPKDTGHSEELDSGPGQTGIILYGQKRDPSTYSFTKDEPIQLVMVHWDEQVWYEDYSRKRILLPSFKSTIHADYLEVIPNDEDFSAFVRDTIAANGIEIVTIFETDIFTNKCTTGSSIDARDLEPYRREQTLAILENQILPKYGNEFLRKHLKKIYILDEIIVNDRAVASTHCDSMLFLVNPSFLHKFHFEKLFHAEFSIMLLEAYPEYFDQDSWMKLNSILFQYVGYDKTLENQLSVAYKGLWPDFEEARNGFVYEFAKSSMKADFGSIASFLFAEHVFRKHIPEKFPVVQKKLDFALRFYNQLDPRFTAEYFDALFEQ